MRILRNSPIAGREIVMALKYMPVNVNLKGAKVLVVGGGTIALRKIEALLNYDCAVHVVSPEVVDKIGFFHDKGTVRLEKREYMAAEASKYRLVVSATDDEEVNQKVHKDCMDFNILVNVVDNPKLCTFTFPAIVRREILSFAISTDGKAPFLAGGMRAILEEIFPQHWTKIAKRAVDFRKTVNEKYKDDIHRRAECFERFLGADWKEILKHKSEDEISAEIAKLL